MSEILKVDPATVSLNTIICRAIINLQNDLSRQVGSGIEIKLNARYKPYEIYEQQIQHKNWVTLKYASRCKDGNFIVAIGG